MKRNVVLALLALLLLINVAGALAQEGETSFAPTPEVTAEATAEATAEPLSISEILAGLPQSRSEDGGFVVGEPDAPITVVEFTDFACPHCQNYRPVIDEVIRQYVAEGKAKFELRILPTAGGQLTYYTGLLLECASHQRLGTFWQAYELLYDYAASGEYDEQIGQRLAEAFELNYDKMIKCADSAKQMGNDIMLAQQIGIGGTPAVLVRYGDGEAEFVTLEGQTYNRGGVDFEVLAQVIEAANEPV